jgi:hypothetical protein
VENTSAMQEERNKEYVSSNRSWVNDKMNLIDILYNVAFLPEYFCVMVAKWVETCCKTFNCWSKMISTVSSNFWSSTFVFTYYKCILIKPQISFSPTFHILLFSVIIASSKFQAALWRNMASFSVPWFCCGH